VRVGGAWIAHGSPDLALLHLVNQVCSDFERLEELRISRDGCTVTCVSKTLISALLVQQSLPMSLLHQIDVQEVFKLYVIGSHDASSAKVTEEVPLVTGGYS
jgi:hypothetical protein